jgi:hypothetical protein
MPLRLSCVVLFALLPLCASCNLLVPMVFVGEHKKRVLPEFDKLDNSRVAILVWTAPSTLFDYPYARFELAAAIGEKLFVETTRRKLDVDLVDARDVEDFLQKNLDARIDPQAVGRAFDADYVIYLEILRFQVRDPTQPQFLRGEINASVSVHDIRADPDRLRRYELTPVECTYPKGPPVLMTATNSPLVREATYRKFAEMVSRKFYAHTVDL